MPTDDAPDTDDLTTEHRAAEDHALAERASRQRKCAASGEAMDEAHLIRFVAGPDGQVVPDLGRKLPGRGVWVTASRTRRCSQ